MNPQSSPFFTVASFYKFFTLDVGKLPELKRALQQKASELQLFGQIILAPEGLNGTVAGSDNSIFLFQQLLSKVTKANDWSFKNSFGQVQAFRKFIVKIRQEIVTSSSTHPVHHEGKNSLSPSEWQKILETEDAVLLDVRNWYETAIGKFQGSFDLQLNHFKDFRQALHSSKLHQEKNVQNKKVLTYCTGGIRCEKVLQEMEWLGYSNVYQLQGGILNYLKHYPHQYFEGECFVFDDRVSLGQDLHPTGNYSFCPHCGQPAQESIDCSRCFKKTRVCKQCLSREHRNTCSLDCAYQRGTAMLDEVCYKKYTLPKLIN